MKQYKELLVDILTNGSIKNDRTGTGTMSVFGRQLRFNLNDGFPLLTTKKIHIRSIIYELLWFLNGDTNISYLNDHGVTIWDEWADEHGDLGPIYGAQWRNWNHTDQISNLIHSIRSNPNSRRHIVSAWNVDDLPDESMTPVENVNADRMALAPCHCFFQCYVDNGKLSLHAYQRSVDCGLGLPFNIASYALLTHMIAQQCDLDVGELVWSSGDTHIYTNHLDQIRLQLTREPYLLPILKLRRANSIFEYSFEDFEILNYVSHAAISMPIAI